MSTIEIFFSYSHEDEALRKELEKHLSYLKRQGIISGWKDRDIGAGSEWAHEIDAHLNSAHIILLLISPDFIASNYCYGVEVKRAMERHKAGEALVIPIILRPVDWHDAPFGKLQALPKDGQPITSWSNRDEAFLDVARGIRKSAKELKVLFLPSTRHSSGKSLSGHATNKKGQIKHLGQCPYQGLFAFQEEDEPYFFGRETFTQQLVDAVQRKPLVAIIGSSGSGKSSVVFAGLIPRLRKERSWLITSLRPGNRPFHSLAVALMPLLEPQMSEHKRLLESNELAQQLQQGKLALQDIIELITQKQIGRRLLLVIDQFEELYTLCTEPEVREHFLDKLISIVQSAFKYDFMKFNLVLTLRADFLGQALTYRPLADALQNADFMLGPMNSQELQDTIRKPAEQLNVQIEDGLTERILREVKQASNRLPLLEFALTLLWNKQRDGRLTHSGYLEIGGVEKALTDHAEKVFAGLSEPEQMQAQQVFMQLVSFGEGTEDTRRLATRSEIGEENWELVMRLSSANARLVVSGRDQISGEDTVEVVHEALIRGWQRLREWMENNREFRTWQERLRATMRQWKKNNRDNGALLHGALLVEAAKWMLQRPKDINQQEKMFIDISQQNRETEEQRWKTLYEEAQRFALLYQAEQELSDITELARREEAFEIVLRIAEGFSKGHVTIRQFDETTQELVLSHATQQHAPLRARMKLDEGLNGQVAREQRTIVVFDIDNSSSEAVSSEQNNLSIRSLLVTPILFKDRYYGNLGLSHEEAGHFRGTDIIFYEGLAKTLASILYRLEIFQTSQELLQQLQSSEEMNSMGQSAFEVTHRIGNDLGLVELYIDDIRWELEKKGVTDKPVFGRLENILQATRAVLDFSSNLKQELSKLRTKEEVDSERVITSPEALLDEVRSTTFLPSFISLMLEIEVDVANVLVFRSSVVDILRNLIENAIQAMPMGGIITLRARNSGRYVALDVSDTGTGIPPHNQSKIFDLFFSTKGSSGFGLWSARRNALKNHGDIRVQSSPGQGTTFTLLLPKTDI